MAIYQPYRSHASSTPRGGRAVVEMNWQEGEQADDGPLTARARTFVDRQPAWDFSALLVALCTALKERSSKGRHVALLGLSSHTTPAELLDPEKRRKREYMREWSRRKRGKAKNAGSALLSLQQALDAFESNTPHSSSAER